MCFLKFSKEKPHTLFKIYTYIYLILLHVTLFFYHKNAYKNQALYATSLCSMAWWKYITFIIINTIIITEKPRVCRTQLVTSLSKYQENWLLAQHSLTSFMHIVKSNEFRLFRQFKQVKTSVVDPGPGTTWIRIQQLC